MTSQVAARRLLILFPGAIGDFLCALPALAALQRAHLGGTLLVANRSVLEIITDRFRHTLPFDRRELSDLFSEGPPRADTVALLGGSEVVHSWSGYLHAGFGERLRRITGGVVHLHRFRGMRPGEHAIDYYARCADVAIEPPALGTTSEDEDWADNWCACHVERQEPLLLVHPGSGAVRKNWQGFPELVAWLSRRRPLGGAIAVLAGPAEVERGMYSWTGVPVVSEASLRRVAALLRRAVCYVGNDSGISHLAAMVGAPSIVLFGPTDPATWAPRGAAVRVLSTAEPCPECGPERFCTHRLAVETVYDAIERAVRPAPLCET